MKKNPEHTQHVSGVLYLYMLCPAAPFWGQNDFTFLQTFKGRDWET